jgi:hypothetical protein
MKIKIVAPPERKYSVWIGGSILASLSTFKVHEGRVVCVSCLCCVMCVMCVCVCAVLVCVCVCVMCVVCVCE